MNKYLEVALEKLDRSRGDIRWEGEKEALLEEATLNVQFAIAHELGRIADLLEGFGKYGFPVEDVHD